MAKTDPTKAQVQRAGLPPPRTPRTRVRATTSLPVSTRPRLEPFRGELLQGELLQGELQGEQRRWFEREVRTLQRLACTERLLGDYVAAQRLGRELDSFIAEVAALMGRERG